MNVTAIAPSLTAEAQRFTDFFRAFRVAEALSEGERLDLVQQYLVS
jgi:hypothetical protein